MIDKIVDGEADTALNRIENKDRFRAWFSKQIWSDF
jgi:hypothetical protein